MIIPNSNIVTHFSRPALHKAPVLKFEVAGETELTRKIECIRADSLKGLYKRLKSRGSPKKNYTSLTVTQENAPKSRFSLKGRAVKVLVKNKDLEKLIGKAEFKRLQTLNSSSDRFSHIKKSIGPLNPLDGRYTLQKGSPPSSDWQKLSRQINNKLKDLFPKLEHDDIKKVRRAVNKMIVSKDTSIFALVDVKVAGKKEQIFLRKHMGKLLIDQAKYCGDGGNATVYKVAGYALKKFRPATEIDEITNTPIANVQDIEEEIQACKAVKAIQGTLKIRAPLKDMESGRLIGYVMKAYDGDFGDYLLSSLDVPKRSLQLCEHFTKIAHTFSQMHQIDKVHTDIKIDNVFANFDKRGITELVVGDITKTDPDNTAFSYSLHYSFQPEIDKIKFSTNLTTEDRLALQKKRDVRQFAFFMYYSIRAEKSNNAQIEGKVQLKDAFPPSDPSRDISAPTYYPNKKERIANYTPIPEEKASRALRDFIEYLLTEDFEKLPSMEDVHKELKEIYSIQSSKLLR